MIDVGAQSNAVMNLKSTQNKRRQIVSDAKLNNFDPSARLAIKEFEEWQMKVFKKNAKKGWRFFNPDSLGKPTPRSSKEAWGGIYKPDLTYKYEKRNERIMLVVVVGILILLSII